MIESSMTQNENLTRLNEHSKLLNGLDNVFEGNRLDYNGTNFKTDYGVNGVSQSTGAPDIVYGKITYALNNPASVKMPTELATEDNAPYTGRGFTGSKEIILPEYIQGKRKLVDGDTLTILEAKTGKVIQKFTFDEEHGWID